MLLLVSGHLCTGLLCTLFLFFITARTLFSTAFPREEMEAARFVYKPRASEGHLALTPMHIPSASLSPGHSPYGLSCASGNPDMAAQDRHSLGVGAVCSPSVLVRDKRCICGQSKVEW